MICPYCVGWPDIDCATDKTAAERFEKRYYKRTGRGEAL
jgi:hypothetical protein